METEPGPLLRIQRRMGDATAEGRGKERDGEESFTTPHQVHFSRISLLYIGFGHFLFQTFLEVNICGR